MIILEQTQRCVLYNNRIVDRYYCTREVRKESKDYNRRQHIQQSAHACRVSRSQWPGATKIVTICLHFLVRRAMQCSMIRPLHNIHRSNRMHAFPTPNFSTY
jgi:hypothetical protein